MKEYLDMAIELRHTHPWFMNVLVAFDILITAPVIEELMFRAFPFWLGSYIGATLILQGIFAILFVLMHTNSFLWSLKTYTRHGNVAVPIIPYTHIVWWSVASILCTSVYMYTGSIYYSILVHHLWNLVMYLRLNELISRCISVTVCPKTDSLCTANQRI